MRLLLASTVRAPDSKTARGISRRPASRSPTMPVRFQASSRRDAFPAAYWPSTPPFDEQQPIARRVRRLRARAERLRKGRGRAGVPKRVHSNMNKMLHSSLPSGARRKRDASFPFFSQDSSLLSLMCIRED